jgi:hypothetical protein
VTADRRHEGWQRLSRADWAGAREEFAAALDADPDDPEALDGLGQALWWLGERDAGIERRQEAYVAYRRRGDARRAGGLATYLAGEHRIDGRPAAAAGWLARAHRLLAGAGTVPEVGWPEIEEAKPPSDPAEGERHARAALAVAVELAIPDIECMALAQLGRALVRKGRVDEGVALLDEAMAVAPGGETSDPRSSMDWSATYGIEPTRSSAGRVLRSGARTRSPSARSPFQASEITAAGRPRSTGGKGSTGGAVRSTANQPSGSGAPTIRSRAARIASPARSHG